mgnify:CR=1 FL=1
MAGCIEGYRMTHANHTFLFENELPEAQLKGSPELFAQMLDKVLTNAIEFSESHQAIVVRVFEKDKQKRVFSNVHLVFSRGDSHLQRLKFI